jgi:bacterioferritin-associated ferredoxin
MYVCLCNGITDRDVRRYAEGGDCSVAMIYRACGAQPRCGKCVAYVRRMLHRDEAAPACEVGGDD